LAVILFSVEGWRLAVVCYRLAVDSTPYSKLHTPNFFLPTPTFFPILAIPKTKTCRVVGVILLNFFLENAGIRKIVSFWVTSFVQIMF
jgi:hypothetical protein